MLSFQLLVGGHRWWYNTLNFTRHTNKCDSMIYHKSQTSNYCKIKFDQIDAARGSEYKRNHNTQTLKIPTNLNSHWIKKKKPTHMWDLLSGQNNIQIEIKMKKIESVEKLIICQKIVLGLNTFVRFHLNGSSCSLVNEFNRQKKNYWFHFATMAFLFCFQWKKMAFKGALVWVAVTCLINVVIEMHLKSIEHALLPCKWWVHFWINFFFIIIQKMKIIN